MSSVGSPLRDLVAFHLSLMERPNDHPFSVEMERHIFCVRFLLVGFPKSSCMNLVKRQARKKKKNFGDGRATPYGTFIAICRISIDPMCSQILSFLCITTNRAHHDGML